MVTQLYKWIDDYDRLSKKERKKWKAKDYLLMRQMLVKYFPEYNTTTLLYISYLEKAKEKIPKLQTIIDCLDSNKPPYSSEQNYLESLNVNIWDALITYKEELQSM
ncbi:hypothetical protein MHB54_28055 [Paenibacillus sp. FSL M7-0802]|uniref:hypothetical protein n=1 Tax=Paenibacillus sp. FSL M7-0802 TaxID=2921536 RepID=UPI0030F716E0